MFIQSDFFIIIIFINLDGVGSFSFDGLFVIEYV